MNEETQRVCLEPFFSTKGTRGTGLGLAMVYGAVQRHAGEITIDSVLGRGTTFRLTFDIVSPPSEARGATGTAVALIPRAMRLLIIDDDPLLIRSLRDTLRRQGHEIVTADSGQGGIDLFRAACGRGERFDAVITDLGMPRVDGRQVARGIKETSATTPVILLTGWGHRLIAEGDVPANVDQVLSKPPTLDALHAALAKVSGL
jgi:CheY-like chemotaxis protein